jgi:hypothetical protein
MSVAAFLIQGGAASTGEPEGRGGWAAEVQSERDPFLEAAP